MRASSIAPPFWCRHLEDHSLVRQQTSPREGETTGDLSDPVDVERRLYEAQSPEGDRSMKYVMFVVGDPDHTEEDAAAAPDLDDWFASVRPGGKYLQGVRLQEAEDATTIRVRGGELLITDGPFTESKEWIAGFAILDCADLDEAIEIAARNPMAYEGRLELRPIHSMGGPDD